MIENKTFRMILILNLVGCAIYSTCFPTGEPQTLLYNLIVSAGYTLAIIGIMTLLKW